LKVEKKDGKQDGDHMSEINTKDLRRLIRKVLLSEQEGIDFSAASSTSDLKKQQVSQQSRKDIASLTKRERAVKEFIMSLDSLMAQKGESISPKVIKYLEIAKQELERKTTMQEAGMMMDDEGKIHDDGHEVDMAESQLYKLAQYAPEVYGMVDNYADLPGWVQKKITLASDYLGSVKHYLEHEHFKAKNHLGENEDGNDL